ncbi:hypothetical protein ACFQZ4_19985 [Catellatospora coxensis]|uniref:Uncharacterized protein n=1 Tax=Catellatospora coxensis TaxID=310354 RepID=A0A8J3KSZ4_9ACTN|nr:hypothetical protein [Catellatospora coxensis]GIG04499.1 hypothetical protein Cco03nite_11990 [Catellatospora coxensis]
MDDFRRRGRLVTVAATVLGALTLAGLVLLVLTWHVDPKSQPGNIVNAVVAAANIAFVIFTWAVFSAGQAQLSYLRAEAQEQRKAWTQEYATAVRSYEESIKARLDQSAPRVSVTLVGAQLQYDDRISSEVQPNTRFAEGSARRLILQLTWRVVNWGEEPVLLSHPDGADGVTSRQLIPGDRVEFSRLHRRPAGEWSSGPPLTCTIEVSVRDLGRDVEDMHVWSAEVVPLTREGVARVADILDHSDPVAVRERRYLSIGGRDRAGQDQSSS